MTGVSPLKVFEYMACGKPVVSTRVEGLEFIEEQGAGRLAQPGDVKGLAEALGELIQNTEKRREMGLKGLQIAREKFDWRLKVAEVEAILKELV